MELILSTFGTLLSRKDNCLLVTSGERKQRLSANDVQSIQVGPGVQLTSESVMFAVENEIDMLFVDRSGMPVGRIWSPKYGSISVIRKGQLAFTASNAAVAWIKGELIKKIRNQQALLLMLPVTSKVQKKLQAKAVTRLEEYQGKIENIDGDSMSDVASHLRGWEGAASRIYFEQLNRHLPEQYRFDVRSQHPAKDIANSFLNYGYGILYGHVEGALIKAGIDPYIGILHRDNYNRPVLVYDVIEEFRVWIDYVVYGLLSNLEIDESYYSVDENGAFWLESLGRRVLIQSVNDYLSEVVTIGKLQRSRATQIQQYAFELAKVFKDYSLNQK